MFLSPTPDGGGDDCCTEVSDAYSMAQRVRERRRTGKVGLLWGAIIGGNAMFSIAQGDKPKACKTRAGSPAGSSIEGTCQLLRGRGRRKLIIISGTVPYHITLHHIVLNRIVPDRTREYSRMQQPSCRHRPSTARASATWNLGRPSCSATVSASRN